MKFVMHRRLTCKFKYKEGTKVENPINVATEVIADDLLSTLKYAKNKATELRVK